MLNRFFERSPTHATFQSEAAFRAYIPDHHALIAKGKKFPDWSYSLVHHVIRTEAEFHRLFPNRNAFIETVAALPAYAEALLDAVFIRCYRTTYSFFVHYFDVIDAVQRLPEELGDRLMERILVSSDCSHLFYGSWREWVVMVEGLPRYADKLIEKVSHPSTFKRLIKSFRELVTALKTSPYFYREVLMRIISSRKEQEFRRLFVHWVGELGFDHDVHPRELYHFVSELPDYGGVFVDTLLNSPTLLREFGSLPGFSLQKMRERLPNYPVLFERNSLEEIASVIETEKPIRQCVRLFCTLRTAAELNGPALSGLLKGNGVPWDLVGTFVAPYVADRDHFTAEQAEEIAWNEVNKFQAPR